MVSLSENLPTIYDETDNSADYGNFIEMKRKIA